MSVRQLFDAQIALSSLMNESIHLLRLSREVKTIKNYLHSYDILQLTYQINKPWDEHPGYVYGDMAAFVDLEFTCREIILSLDPSPEAVKKYILDINRFLIYWKKSQDNKVLTKPPFTF
jgi:hypothetical protein